MNGLSTGDGYAFDHRVCSTRRGNGSGDGSGDGNGFGSGDGSGDGDGSSYGYAYRNGPTTLLDVRCLCGGSLNGQLQCERCGQKLTSRQVRLIANGSESAKVALRLGAR
jgi:hypothetical protein